MSAAAPAPGPRAICVLGMHRAGTSMLARAVNLLGADLGPAGGLMPATPDNPEGYWERVEIWALHERILGALRRTWDATVPLPDGWEEAPALSPLRAELAVLVQRTFGGAPLFAWKDPRTCLLLPLWREALAGHGAALSIVFVVRSPLDVARSLERRDGIPLAKGFAVWCVHTLAGLRALRGLPSVFVAYDAFLEDGERELRRVAQALGIAWPADGAGLRAALGSFVRPALRHSASTPADLAAAGAPAPVSELAGLLGRLVAGERVDEPANLGRVETLWRDLCIWGSFTAVELDALFETRQALAGAREELARERGVVAGMRASWSWRLTRSLRALDRLLAGR